MADDSRLDSMYFIDRHRYNCPYCNRRHVTFHVSSVHEFDWTDKKKCYVIFVKCESCQKESMHLSYAAIAKYVGPGYHFVIEDGVDRFIFYSVPTSYHVIDAHIPPVLRELLDEAQGCLKSNFLTGASACVRKIVYELARLQKAEGENYDERIKNLKQRLPSVDPTYFDTLLTIQQVTSDKVHEESYDGWESRHLRAIIASLVEALQEIYVLPKRREERRAGIVKLKDEILGEKKEKT
jgi:hypothetical protein